MEQKIGRFQCQKNVPGIMRGQAPCLVDPGEPTRYGGAGVIHREMLEMLGKKTGKRGLLGHVCLYVACYVYGFMLVFNVLLLFLMFCVWEIWGLFLLKKLHLMIGVDKGRIRWGCCA